MGQSSSARRSRAIVSAISAFSLLAIASPRSKAENFTWVGGSGLWRDGTKWNPINQTPTAGDEVSIPSGQVLFDNTNVGGIGTQNITIGGTLNIQGNPYGGGVLVRAIDNININAGGKILLDSYDPALNSFSSGVEADFIYNHGNITATSGTGGGARQIGTYTELQNFAGASINAQTSLSTFGNITNAGAFNVSFGTTSITGEGGFINAPGGTITIANGAYMLMAGGTFYYLGGTIAGEVELQNNVTLVTTTANGNGAKFQFSRSGGQLVTNFPANTSLRVTANAVQGNNSLTIPNSITNYGNILLDSDDGPFSSTLNVSAGTLTNQGFIVLGAINAGGPRALIGTIINNFGIYDVTAGDTTIDGDLTNNNVYERFAGGTTTVRPDNHTAIFRQNAGQLIIHPGASFFVQGSTFAFGGGTISGPITLHSSAHLQTTTPDGHGALFNFAGNGAIDTDLSSNVHVTLTGVNGNVTVNDGAKNHGTIELFNTLPYYTALNVFKPATNDNTGTYTNTGAIIASDPNNQGSSRVINGNLTNLGQVLVHHSLDIYGTLRNTYGGSITVDQNQALTIHDPANKLIQDGGSIYLAKNASLDFAGASYQYLSGSITVAGNFTTPGAITVGPADSLTAAGPDANFTIAAGGVILNSGALIGQDGGSLIGQDGGTIVAQGGGNIVAQGGGNIVAQGGGNIVAQGGGNAPAVPAPRPFPLSAPTPGAPIPADPASSIIADGGTLQLNAGSFHADGNGILRNAALLTGNGTFTAATFDISSTSTITATGGALHLVGPINQYTPPGTLTAGHWQIKTSSTLDTPNIGPITTNNAAVTLEGPASIWTNINSLAANNGTFTLAAGRSFTTAGALNNTGALAVTGLSSQITVAGPLANSGSIAVEGLLNIQGPLTGAGALNIASGASATATSIRQTSLTLSGTLTLPVTTTAPTVSIVQSLTLTGGALDIGSGVFIIDYPAAASPLATIRAAIIAGRNNGNWQGQGIRSTAAANSPSGAIGYAEASELLSPTGGSFKSNPVDGSAIILRYTREGDATLDGVVDFNDLVKLAQNYNTNVSATDSWWFKGDFTNDGVVDFNDLVKLAQNYNTSMSNPAAPIPGASPDFQEAWITARQSAVPEPATPALLTLTAVTLLKRKRKNEQAPLQTLNPNPKS